MLKTTVKHAGFLDDVTDTDSLSQYGSVLGRVFATLIRRFEQT